MKRPSSMERFFKPLKSQQNYGGQLTGFGAGLFVALPLVPLLREQVDGYLWPYAGICTLLMIVGHFISVFTPSAEVSDSKDPDTRPTP